MQWHGLGHRGWGGVEGTNGDGGADAWYGLGHRGGVEGANGDGGVDAVAWVGSQRVGWKVQIVMVV